MLTKENVLTTVSKLPDRFSLDELIDRLILIEKVQRGLDESVSNKVHSKDKAKERLTKWLQ